MSILKRLRPSNLIIIFALPFIAFLFATSTDYSRSLTAIVGIEAGAERLVPGFLLFVAAFLSSLLAVFWTAPARLPKWGRWAIVAASLASIGALVLALSDLAGPFLASLAANSVDPFTSDLVIRGESPRRLTDAARTMIETNAHVALAGYAALSIAGMVLLFQRRSPALGQWARRVLGVVNGIGFLYVILFGYLGFASGVATSIRAAVLAYALAAVLGLVWVGLLQLKLHRRTPWIFGGLVVLLVTMAVFQFSQPAKDFVLVGALSGKIGIVKGTPDSLIAAVQFGAFPGATSQDMPIRSFGTADKALAAVAVGDVVGAALVPAAAVSSGQAVLWHTSALPDDHRAIGTAAAVIAIVLALLTLGGAVHQRHPMAVGAEFIVDTIRGIPMLVIVLYIGLPLAGAIKEASGGFLDPPNLMRGIVAMALAYSAYLAEIFRAGINAVPAGQIEAARSLGLGRWQTARRVIMPQAFRIIIPPLGNEFIAILKDTSLLSILSIRDITQRMREFQSATFLPFAPYNSAAIFYVLLTLVAASLIASIERKFDVRHR